MAQPSSILRLRWSVRVIFHNLLMETVSPLSSTIRLPATHSRTTRSTHHNFQPLNKTYLPRCKRFSIFTHYLTQAVLTRMGFITTQRLSHIATHAAKISRELIIS